ncbi:MAG: enoyl-CoA hydratase/isomerase family protein [Planctomycetota bacterium]
MSETLATLEVSEKIGTLTLRRPEARNALSIPLLDDLLACVSELESTVDAGRPTVLVVTGEGRAFCAGMDLKAVMGDPEAPPQLLNRIADLSVRLRSLPQVVVAQVNGAAIGGGCGLACACDLLVTHADAKLGFPEVDLGVCPAVVAPLLVRKIGPGRARRVLLSGGVMSGSEADALGMVDALAPDRDSLGQVAEELAKRLASGGPAALAATKRLLNELDGSVDGSRALLGAEISASVLRGEEARTMLAKAFAGS